MEIEIEDECKECKKIGKCGACPVMLNWVKEHRKMNDVFEVKKKSKWIFTKTALDKYGSTVECPSCHKK